MPRRRERARPAQRNPDRLEPKRRRWLGPTIAAVTLLLFVGVPEVVTRLIDPPLNQYRAIYFGGDPR